MLQLLTSKTSTNFNSDFIHFQHVFAWIYIRQYRTQQGAAVKIDTCKPQILYLCVFNYLDSARILQPVVIERTIKTF